MRNPIDDIEEIALGALDDHELLAGAQRDLMMENFYASRRVARIDEFRQRRDRDFKARKADEPHFTLTALAETVVEVGPLLGHDPGKIKADCLRTKTLREHFPAVWDLCRRGQLDLYKASIISDTVKYELEDAADLAKLAGKMSEWLNKCLEDKADDDLPFITKTSKQLRNKLNYELKKIKRKDADERFRRAFKDRGVRVDAGMEGMGYLTLNHTAPDLQAALYHLTLIAKTLRKRGDERTLDQLRADTMLDLIMGRLTVGASTGELEAEETKAGGDPAETVRRLPTANYARPIINVVVPIQTLMGVSDEPGVLSGGEAIPAGLVRKLAQDPESTWYRMLTDPARHCVEISTKSYKPTESIWRTVVADYNSCFHPSCTTPATTCEIDHRVPWPRGNTSTENLGPACKREHTAKHAKGFSLEKDDDGTLVFKTAAGFTHKCTPAEQPVSDQWPEDWFFDSQFSATEVLEALRHLRSEDEAINEVAFQKWQLEKLWAGYRVSYPEASDDEIHYWIYGDPFEAEEDHQAPPLLKQGDTAREVRLAEEHRRSEWAA